MHPLFKDISSLPTERINPATVDIDVLPTREIVALLHAEDARVIPAVGAELAHIAAAVDLIVAAFQRGGRLIYVGAGTSGRLGVVDASECPPTFGTAPEMVQGIIAGGSAAMFRSQEGVEDSRDAGAAALDDVQVKSEDVVCGIAASGRTPFVLGALARARARGCKTIFVSTSTPENIRGRGVEVDVLICPQVGPEPIAGSTRMKSGTAQKLVLNMLTTAAMVRIGKTYHNVMVDLQLSNGKLEARARRTVMEVCGVDYDEAERALTNCGGHVKTAIVSLIAGVNCNEARTRLARADGRVRAALRDSAADQTGDKQKNHLKGEDAA